MEIQDIKFSGNFMDAVKKTAVALSADNPSASCPPPFLALEISIVKKDIAPMILLEFEEPFFTAYIYKKM